MEKTLSENKLGTQPIPSLLFSMSVPLIIANLITALYNIVDGIYVARLSQTAFTATSLAFPAQLLVQAVSSGTAGGVGSLLSRKLGAKEFDSVRSTAMHGIILESISYLVFLVLGIFLVRPFLAMFTTDTELLSLGVSYLSICVIYSFGMFFTFLFHRLLEAVGHPGYCLIMQSIGAVLNIILDPILIFGMFGIKPMGIAGAAIATVFSQFVSAVFGLIFNLKFNKDISISFKGFKFDKEIIKDIYEVAVPSMIMMMIGSVMNVGMNKILITADAVAVSIFGIYYKYQSFVFMPVFGITQGMVPIVGYNYGAKCVSRMKQATKLALCSNVIIMAIGTLIFQLFPRQLLILFNANEEMFSLGIPALRIISIHFIVAAACISLGDTLVGMGIGYVSAINSFLRQLLILLPVAYFLVKVFGVHYVWFAFLASELTSFAFTTVMFIRIWRKKVVPLEKVTV